MSVCVCVCVCMYVCIYIYIYISFYFLKTDKDGGYSKLVSGEGNQVFRPEGGEKTEL